MRLHYEIPNDLSKLHDELLAAIPSLRPEPDPNTPPTPLVPNPQRAVMVIEGTATDVWLTVPDDADVAAIDAVIAAHDPAPPPTPPTQAEQVDALVANGKAAIEAAPITTDEGRALATIFSGALDGLRAIYGTQQP